MLKLCAIDIDGVLCEYPEGWLGYIKLQTKKDFNNLSQAKMTLSFSEYKILKDRYRNSGFKAHLKPILGASHLTQYLKRQGYIIVLLTARPIYQIKQVLCDTLSWLEKNKVAYHLIFEGKDKHIKLLKYFKEISFVIEDNHQVANEIAEHGFKVYLLDNPYNQHPLKQGVVRIKKLEEVIKNETKN